MMVLTVEDSLKKRDAAKRKSNPFNGALNPSELVVEGIVKFLDRSQETYLELQ